MQNALIDLKKLERCFLDGLGKAVEPRFGAMLGELAGRLEGINNTEGMRKALGARRSMTNADSQGSDNEECPPREACKDIVALVKQVEVVVRKLEARFDKLEASAASRLGRQAPQGDPSTKATPTTDQSNEDDGAPTSVLGQQEKIALVQAAIAAATGLGGQASLNVTVTASSVSFAITKGGGANSPPPTATPTTSSAQQTEPSRARDKTTMPPAKRPRTEEGHGHGNDGRNASETLTGGGEDDENCH